ncbi:MAG TPA: hypothetical protein VN579_04610, partial [Bryobacteraceae bacterium]|nr:hypothetical protein [Bryobacteraceae bacterium]
MQKVALISSCLVAGLFVPIWAIGQTAAPTSSATSSRATSSRQEIAAARETGAALRICGVVRTSEGLAVPGAAVRLSRLPAGNIWETSTDETG